MEKKKGYRAYVKYLLVSPSKMRRIARVIKNKPYSEAMSLLAVLPQKGARFLKKIVASAAANAIYNNKKIDEDMLYIKELSVNDGPRYKRLWARSRGRADILLKRMCHVYVEVEEIATAGGKSGTKG